MNNIPPDRQINSERQPNEESTSIHSLMKDNNEHLSLQGLHTYEISVEVIPTFTMMQCVYFRIKCYGYPSIFSSKFLM